MKYCPNCGNQCSDNANFCMNDYDYIYDDIYEDGYDEVYDDEQYDYYDEYDDVNNYYE